MTITENLNNASKVLRLTGTFDFQGRKGFQAAIEKAREGGARQIILNLQGVPYMDSAALGMLFLMHKKFTAEYIHVTFVNPQDDVKRILELANMDKLFSIHATEEQAIAHMAKA